MTGRITKMKAAIINDNKVVAMKVDDFPSLSTSDVEDNFGSAKGGSEMASSSSSLGVFSCSLPVGSWSGDISTGAAVVGRDVGLIVGFTVDFIVGFIVNFVVRFVVGLDVGFTDGLAVGFDVGFVVGLVVGLVVGDNTGIFVIGWHISLTQFSLQHSSDVEHLSWSSLQKLA